MTVEREIAGFALPFAAGVLSASLFNSLSYHALNAAAMPVCVAGMLFLTTYHKRESANVTIIRCIVFLCAFLTGMFCFSNAAIIETGAMERVGLLTSFAHSCCASVQELIDSLPFENRETPALLKALLTGEKSSIPRDVTEAFRISGASHILALSGMHLGIIYGIVSRTLASAGNSRDAIRARSAAIIAICAFYTLAVGAGESIVRAFLFILISEISRLTHRFRSLKQTLMTALIIQLALSPASIESVGFQLSYAAMAGIAFIHPWLQGLWPDEGRKDTLLQRIWNMASMSISCQLTTGPLAWYYFRSFPTHFLLTNLMAIPLTGLIVPSAILTLVLHALGICPAFMIRLTEALVSAMTGSLAIIAEM